MAQAAKLAGSHCKDVEAMALDTGKKIVADQAEWLDKVMKDLLPPDLYAAGLVEEREQDIADYAQKHGIVVIFIPDSIRIRVMCHGKVHAEFVPQLLVDGEPVSMTPEIPLDSSRN